MGAKFINETIFATVPRWSGKPQPSPQTLTINENQRWRSRSDSGVTLQRNLGARRIQSELKRLHSISLAMATIHKVLCQNQVKPVVKFRRKANFIRYERPVPGDRVQMDTCKIGPGLYQYTSVDDCTRYRVLRLYDPTHVM